MKVNWSTSRKTTQVLHDQIMKDFELVFMHVGVIKLMTS